MFLDKRENIRICKKYAKESEHPFHERNEAHHLMSVKRAFQFIVSYLEESRAICSSSLAPRSCSHMLDELDLGVILIVVLYQFQLIIFIMPHFL